MTTLIYETKEVKPNPLSLKVGEKVIMDAEYDNPVEVIVDKISHTGYAAKVTEKVSGKKWSVSINCLSR